jgi:hypothetical protein
LQHYLAFELWAELPSLAHVTFPLLDYDTAFSSVSNLRGSLQLQKLVKLPKLTIPALFREL